MDVELGRSVVFIGPNSSGKTTALQALTLWELGLRQWFAKRGGKAPAEKRPGIAINRRDLISIPVPSANLLWKNLHVMSIKRQEKGKAESTLPIRIEIVVDGVTDGTTWSCGLEFNYTNEESFVCRPIRLPGYEDSPVKETKFTTIPDVAASVKVAYLPPMSGLAATEPKWEPGRINVLLGEGQTAQVLRNLCFQIYEKDLDHQTWKELCERAHALFGVKLQPPKHFAERGEITMEYEESSVKLDLSASGRGLQQTLLLLAHLYANPKTILLLDEPDAHLEILRQRQIFQILTETADKQGAQVIAASHSEVVLNEAATRGQVVAFVGKPHVLTDRSSQLLKALSDIGFDQYYLAQQTGWVLYLEAATDLAILQEFALLLNHPAQHHLKQPFVNYVSTNLPQKARDHFYGLQEAKPDLAGIAIFDRLDKELHKNAALKEVMWGQREIENYFCSEDVLVAFARGEEPNDLFANAQRDRREQAMRESIREVSRALETLAKPNPWSPDIKASDDFLDPLFADFSKRLSLPLVLRKSEYCELVKFLPKDKVDAEITLKLNEILEVAKKASPCAS
jgi:ABC-type arginine transport system ATPase subunit